MARPDQQRLAVLLKLAGLREQRAAQVLGELTGQLQAAYRQAEQLAGYQLEYAQQLRDDARAGISPRNLRNYDRFCSSLSSARDTQLKSVADTEQRREQLRVQWSDRYAKRRLLEQLCERRQLEADKLADARLQREQDDKRESRPGLDAAPIDYDQDHNPDRGLEHGSGHRPKDPENRPEE